LRGGARETNNSWSKKFVRVCVQPFYEQPGWEVAWKGYNNQSQQNITMPDAVGEFSQAAGALEEATLGEAPGDWPSDPEIFEDWRSAFSATISVQM
jgi:hypothetical protein